MHPLYRALFNLVDQIDKSDFKDSLGQSAKMLQAMKEAKEVLVDAYCDDLSQGAGSVTPKQR